MVLLKYNKCKENKCLIDGRLPAISSNLSFLRLHLKYVFCLPTKYAYRHTARKLGALICRFIIDIHILYPDSSKCVSSNTVAPAVMSRHLFPLFQTFPPPSPWINRPFPKAFE